jgi:hypothetical protein
MGKIFRMVITLWALISISACGFEPVYGGNSTRSASLSSISFADPVSNADFVFLGYAEQTIPHSDEPTFKIYYSTTFSDGFEVSDNRIVRGSLVYSIRRIEDNKVLFSGNIRRITDMRIFSGESSWIANENNKERVERELSRNLAHALHLDLMSKFAVCGDSCRL